jgi:hypothetical protein
MSEFRHGPVPCSRRRLAPSSTRPRRPPTWRPGRRHRSSLSRRRMLAVGLGLPAALLSMIPLVAIVVMPVAFAGGVLVALDALGLAQPGKQRRSALPFD